MSPLRSGDVLGHRESGKSQFLSPGSETPLGSVLWKRWCPAATALCRLQGAVPIDAEAAEAQGCWGKQKGQRENKIKHLRCHFKWLL